MLKDFAWDWLFAIVVMLNWEGDQLTWTNLKPRFQTQFATQTDKKLIIDGLSNLAMKPDESTGELLARITNTMVIIKESYLAYENKVDALAHHDANGGYLAPTARKWRNDSINNAMQFFKMQLFQVALPRDICKVVAQQNPNTITLDNLYQITTTMQREAGSKTRKTLAAIYDNKNNDSDNVEVATFQKRKFVKSSDKKKKLQHAPTPIRNFLSRTGPGNKSNRNGKYCFYCKLQNHTPEDCFKRIREKKPCKADLFGQKCTFDEGQTVITWDSSRFFTHEPDDTPHPGFKHHSTINSQFMYNFKCNLFEWGWG
jgi:hypothetical protein